VSNSSSSFFVKEPGSMLNPANWWTMARGLMTGAPERTVRMMPINKDENQEGPLVMIDGAGGLLCGACACWLCMCASEMYKP
jgi:hypothetical protein